MEIKGISYPRTPERGLPFHSSIKVVKNERVPLMVTQWLRYCATNRKVAGSIPDGVSGIFHLHNPSDRTMALAVDSASNRNEYQEHFWG
jgi:hypothetical protein